MSSTGIPARRHPDYREAVLRISALAQQAEARHQAQLAAVFAHLDEAKERGLNPESQQFKDEQRAIIEDPQYSCRDIYREQRELAGPAVRSNLYRFENFILSIRYDKVGKAAWAAERKRLEDMGK